MYKTVDTTTLRNHVADVMNEVALRKEYILVTRKAKLKGDMGKVMRYVQASTELVNCVLRVQTEWLD